MLTKEIVSIKGTREGLVIVFDPNYEFEEIKKSLRNKMEAANNFFKGAKFTFGRAVQAISSQQRLEIENICQQYGLVPFPKASSLAFEGKNIKLFLKDPVLNNGLSEQAWLVPCPLRSGQEINCPGHLVVIGDVHSGAKVAAAGNVVVMGTCAGTVCAGEKNNYQAVIIALSIDKKSCLVIAGVNAEPGVNSNSLKKQAQIAFLEGQKIAIEPYPKNKLIFVETTE
ncbi:MAG TPA: septum site-determining protein MinC [Desulfotomaculum sp.]|jgi:septum site-determining protein MinC|nr:septum site-determining protein MinC [Desulfotomaculum sp.]